VAIFQSSPNSCRTSAINSSFVKFSNGGGCGLLQDPPYAQQGFWDLGFTDYVSHEGERPMAIRWRC
jgi:hypothetical protein